jgi:hypothetical protein
MAEYASKGLANGLGIPAVTMAGLALLNQTNNGQGGILGNLLGGGYNNQVMTLMTENTLLKSENYADKVSNEVYKQALADNNTLSDRLMDKYISPMAQEIADSKVREATMNAEIKCIKETSSLKEQLFNARLNEVALVANNGLTGLQGQINCLQQTVNGITKVVVPTSAVCPQPMPLYNSWSTPTTPTT